MEKIRVSKSSKVRDAYNDLGHLGRHKLTVEEIIVLNALLSEMLKSWLLLYDDRPCGLRYMNFMSDGQPSYLAGGGPECSPELREKEQHTHSQDTPNSPYFGNSPS